MSTPAKRVLVLATKLGYQTRSFEKAAEQLGVELVYATDRCHQLEDPWGDRAIGVAFHEPERAAQSVVAALGSRSIDGIVALGDKPVVAAALAARRLGIDYHHPASAEACRSKLRLREVFRDAGLPSPWFKVLPVHPTPEPALHGVSYPCVLKPLSLSASQGVVRADNRDEFLAAAARIRKLLESVEIQASREPHLDRMIVEGYIPGREVAVEGLVTAGQLRVLAIFDKPDPLEGPYFEETLYTTPSRSGADEQRILDCARESVRALGLSHGPVHAEFRVNEAGVWPLEVAPRPIGGLCAGALRFGPDARGATVSLEELLLLHALGMEGAELPRERAASGVMMIPVPASGILEAVRGQDVARRVPGIDELVITARLHDSIARWPEGSTYLGFLFARGETAGQVEDALRKAHEQLEFQIRAELPVEHPTAAKRRAPGGPG